MERGEPRAAEELLPLVYDELRRLAAIQLAQEKPGQTLQATALVHEAWLRVVGNKAEEQEPKWEGRRHFFGAVAEHYDYVSFSCFSSLMTWLEPEPHP
jgi:hypothetical protein